MPTRPASIAVPPSVGVGKGAYTFGKRVLAIHGEDYTRQYHICIDKVLPFFAPFPLCLCWHTLSPPAFQWLTSSIALLEVTASMPPPLPLFLLPMLDILLLPSRQCFLPSLRCWEPSRISFSRCSVTRILYQLQDGRSGTRAFSSSFFYVAR